MTDTPHEAAAPERGPEVIDPRPRQLLEKYASLTGILLLDLSEGLLEFEVPPAERVYWGKAPTVRVAVTPEALEEDPEAELLGIGSPVLERLLTAIRARGFIDRRGLVAPTADPSPEGAPLPAVLDGVEAGACRVELSLLPVGRLLARVSIQAGARLEERLVESALVDLSTGIPVDPSLTQVLDVAGEAAPEGARAVPRRNAQGLLPLLFGQLEQQMASDITRLREEAERHAKAEIDRLERYYTAKADEVDPDDDAEDVATAKEVIRAELARRRDEELERSRIRVIVHPLQLTEWQVLAQRATWTLSAPGEVTGELVATRLLSGNTEWRLACPTCGAAPSSIRLCIEGHASCPACSEHCGVCSRTACRSHGLATCAAEGHPVCDDHARTCKSCGTQHCSLHSGHCAAGDHDVCPACTVRCARCDTALCRAHAHQTDQDAPRGARWLCDACTVHCEGGSSEPIGLDEANRCTSCDRYVCERHKVACAVDGQPHCSRHLRRSDRGGRLICEQHRATCAEEPASILASDEVAPCRTCGKVICETHGGTCTEDGGRHCLTHLMPLKDLSGRHGCEAHRTTCHVDGVTFSLTGTKPCPVCGKPACETHRVACRNCARQVCVRDLEEGRCVTCRHLQAEADPSDDLIQAVLAANGGEPPKAKGWKVAQDASDQVGEVDLGWTRRLVVTVPHGETRPRTAVLHSMLGAKRVR